MDWKRKPESKGKVGYVYHTPGKCAKKPCPICDFPQPKQDPTRQTSFYKEPESDEDDND